MNIQESQINTYYGIPQNFYELISPYLDDTENGKIATKPHEIVAIWKAAIVYRKIYPQLQETIAEWTISAAASSPLVQDNNIFEAVHAQFGALEVPSAGHNEKEWASLEELVEQASKAPGR